jgi:hypothetical protein
MVIISKNDVGRLIMEPTIKICNLLYLKLIILRVTVGQS